MNVKRAVVASILLYLSFFVLFGIFRFVGGIDAQSYSIPLPWFIIFWILCVPLTFGWAKWYFRKDIPTAKKGLLLGIVVIAVAFLTDGIAYTATVMIGESAEVFSALYGDWKFIVTFVWVALLCVFAGWEFDSTYTAPKK